MSISGCLFDFNKLNDVSKNILSRMTAEEVYEKLTVWASAFDPDFAGVLTADKEMAIKILAIGRGGKKPRKDLATWADAKPYMGFFYDKFFTMEDEYPAFDKEIIKATLEKFLETYNYADEMNVWFDKIKAIADSLGFASDMKAYKANPEAFKGNVADISAFIRVAVTGKQNAPDLYTVMQIIGEEKTRARVSAQIEALK
jgi:glutamyl-tRNA synthetase